MKKNTEGYKEILIVPIGKVMVDILNEITVALRKTYQCHVKLGRSEEPPTDCYSDERRQFDAEKLAQMLEQRRHSKLMAVLGVVDGDIFYGDKAFAFCMNKPQQALAVIGLSRLRPEYYGKPADIEILMQRAVKEAIYQAAMAAGLAPCNQKKCLLSPSASLWRLDEKTPRLCDVCRGKVAALMPKARKEQEAENINGEGPDGQPRVMEDDQPQSHDRTDDESEIASEMVEPEGPLASEEEALHNDGQELDEPMDADARGE
jgi:archaemetzincin